MPIIGVIASSAKGAPAAPIIGTATDVGTARAFNNGAATITFTPGAGATATSFTATSSPGGFTATGASSPLTVAGLQSGVSYTFTVTATNAAGTSPASSASNSITATTVPQAPTIGTATAGSGQATVTFTANATGGKTITGFTATSSPGSITGTNTTSPITVTGLTNGTAYTFTVTATNANGTSAASAASNSVTPALPGLFDNIATANLQNQVEVVITNIPTSYKHLIARWTARGDSELSTQWRINGVTSNDYYDEVGIGLSNNTTSFSQARQTAFARGSRASGNQVTGNVAWFPNSANTSYYRNMVSYFGGSDTANLNGQGIQAAVLNTTSATTSITLRAATLSFAGANTSLSLYGIL